MRRQFQVSSFRFQVFILFLPLAFLWFVLINHLRVEWTLNPQYGYGWAVPFLCAYLLWQRVRRTEDGGKTELKLETGNLKTDVSSQRSEFRVSGFRFQVFALALCALLYAPTRLVEEANPDWRLVSWALAIEVIGITLCVASMAQRAWCMEPDAKPFPFHPSLFALRTSHFAFPLCFFLVAVPWPTMIEGPLIQGLTRADAGATCELLGWLGIPAMPHGNVIEVATGDVGIDEACSGIRSFQATLMISLFLGELYRLSVRRRFIFCFAGFAMSFGFNLARMAILVWVAARNGIGAIAKWHDPAGVTILVACFCGLWGLGILLKGGKQKAETGKLKSEGENQTLKIETRPPVSAFCFPCFCFLFAVWILAVEISVGLWYRSHEARLPRAAQWTVAFPTNNPTFAESSLPARTRQILRYDEGRSASWRENETGWQMIFLRWNPGRTAVHLAQNHTPAVCLTAAGHTLNAVPGLQWLDVNGLRLPFLIYEVMDAPSLQSGYGDAGTPRPFFVFYCLWDDRASAQGFETMSLNYGSRFAPVLAGLRNPGQRSLEIAVTGADNAAAAETAVRDELKKIVSVMK